MRDTACKANSQEWSCPLFLLQRTASLELVSPLLVKDAFSALDYSHKPDGSFTSGRDAHGHSELAHPSTSSTNGICVDRIGKMMLPGLNVRAVGLYAIGSFG